MQEEGAYPGVARRSTTVVIVVATVLNLIPIWSVAYPPLQDYANHLAGAYLLAHWNDPGFQRPIEYSFVWAPYPNLGATVLLPLFHKLLPIRMAGRVLLTLYVVAFPAAVLFFFRSLRPRPPDWTNVASLFFVYNFFFAAGFVNFCLGVPLYFTAFGLWIRWRNELTPRRVLGLATLAEAAYFVHLHVFLSLVFSMGVWEATTQEPRRQWSRLTLVLAPSLLNFVWWLSIPVPEWSTPLDLLRLITWRQKLGFTLFPVRSGLEREWGVGSPADFLALVSLVLFFLVSLRRPWVAHRQLAWLLAAMGLTAGTLPFMALSGEFADGRLMLLMATMAPAALHLRPRWPACWATLLCAAFLFRIGSITAEWKEMDRVLRSYAAGFKHIPAGTRVCPLIYETHLLPRHVSADVQFSCYLLIDRQAFVPLFSNPRQYALRIPPEVRVQGRYAPEERPDWQRVSRNCDYVWTLRAAHRQAELEAWGDRIFVSGQNQIYRRKPSSQQTNP